MVLLPILLTDIINPVLFGFMVYAAGGRRPVATSGAMLLGHTIAYLLAGVVLTLFMEKIVAYLANPRTIDFVIELVLAVVLLWLAFASKGKETKKPDEDQPRLTIAGALGFGAVVNFIGIPFAVPYFAAIDQILKANLSVAASFGMLLAYNLAYALPFLVVPVLVAIMGERARPLLARINATIDRVGGVLMPLMLGLVGLALLADSISYFWRGEPLF